MDERLRRAKSYLAIAESKDARREAYKAAAKEITAYKQETGATYADIAVSLGRSEPTIKKLAQWQREGFKAETPFLMDEQATTRAAISHTKATLRNADKATIKKVLGDLPPEQKAALAVEALADVEAVEHVKADKKGRSAVNRIGAEVALEDADRIKLLPGHTHRESAKREARLQSMLATFAADLHRELRELRDTGSAGLDREVVLELVEDCEAGLTWLKTFMKSGTWDQELEDLLGKGR